MEAQRSIGPPPPPSPSSHASGRDSTPEQRDALQRVALGFQAVVRAIRHDMLVSTGLSAERSSLCLAVAEYAALRRGSHATPEQVLVSLKAVTTALSTSTDPTTADILGRLVLKAYLAGYYGDGARPRSLANVTDDVRMR